MRMSIIYVRIAMEWSIDRFNIKETLENQSIGQYIKWGRGGGGGGGRGGPLTRVDVGQVHPGVTALVAGAVGVQEGGVR